MIRLILSIFLLSTCHLLSEENQEDWICHYVRAEQAYADHNGPVAIEEFTKAIKLVPDQLFLYVERARIYEKMKNYQAALKDLSLVIDSPKAHNQDLIPALWGRAKIYMILEDFENMDKDYDSVLAIDPSRLENEINDQYMILRNISPYLINDPQFQEAYTSGMIELGYCNSPEDVTYIENGVAIVKRKSGCGSNECQVCKKKVTNRAHCENCGINSALAYETKVNNPTKETDCTYWCKRISKTAEIGCEAFKTTKCRIACRQLVSWLKSQCFSCCNGGGFYVNCVKPFENYLEKVGCQEPIW